MVVDAGDCGACLHEVKQLNNPLYNMHRLGFFLTATPRTADLLLVVGPVSENMRGPLLKTYEAMPDTKRVMAVGACAITGGVFGRSFMSAGGVRTVFCWWTLKFLEIRHATCRLHACSLRPVASR